MGLLIGFAKFVAAWVVIICILGIIGWISSQSPEAKEQNALDTKFAEVINISGPLGLLIGEFEAGHYDYPPKIANGRFLICTYRNSSKQGRILTIDHDLQTKLPPSLRIESTDIVSTWKTNMTLIVVQGFIDDVGYYSGGGRAYKQWDRIYVIDLPSLSPRGKDVIIGGEPPSTISGSGSNDGYGSSPDIIGWVREFAGKYRS